MRERYLLVRNLVVSMLESSHDTGQCSGKTHLSRYLDATEKGEVVILCRHNKPLAELRAIAVTKNDAEVPRFGRWEGFGVPDSLFEPLPDELVKGFSGE